MKRNYQKKSAVIIALLMIATFPQMALAFTGSTTFYYADCTSPFYCSGIGYPNCPTIPFAALGFNQIAAGDCMKCAQVNYGGNSVIVQVVDRCGGCDGVGPYGIDLAPEAFLVLAPFAVGRMTTTWDFVSCSATIATKTRTPSPGPTPSWTPYQSRTATPTRTVTRTATRTSTPVASATSTPVPLYATAPYCFGFETGDLGSAFTADSINTGRIRIMNTEGPHTGNWHAVLDDSPTDLIYGTNALTLHINLAGASLPVLSYWSKHWGDEPQALPLSWTGDIGGPNAGDAGDGIGISEDGVNWFRLAAYATNLNWTLNNIDLEPMLATFSDRSQVRIRFIQHDNFEIPSDGYAFDDICINTIVVTPSFTSTATRTHTRTSTATPVPPTFTQTPQPPTLTWTRTVTPTRTSSPTRTVTRTVTPTFTRTSTPTQTIVVSPTLTPTSTTTRTNTPLVSSTSTVTPTFTVTVTPFISSTSTWTHTPTITPTVTMTNTATVTRSFTYTPTPPGTYTHTPTVTLTATPTLFFSHTPTYTVTSIYTLTMSPVNTATFTSTLTSLPTVTYTRTQTAVNTATATHTITVTVPPSPTLTGTLTPYYSPTSSVTPGDSQAPVITAGNPVPGAHVDTGVLGPFNGVQVNLQDLASGVDLGNAEAMVSLLGPSGPVAGKLAFAGNTFNADLTFSPALPLASGSYSMVIAACDLAGNCNQQVIQFTVGSLTGPNVIEFAYGVPSPNPSYFAFMLAGPVDEIQCKVYTKAMTLVGDFSWKGSRGPGWAQVSIPHAQVSQWANGLYYLRVWGLREGQAGEVAGSKFMILR